MEQDFLEGYHKKRFLVVGDLMLDEYLFCEFNRVSPEAPAPVYRVLDRQYNLGGAGNVAANLVSLGGQADIIGQIGEDESGKKLISLMQKWGIEKDLLLVSRECPTTTKTRVMAGTYHQVLRVDNEKISPPGQEAALKICSFIKDNIHRYDCLVLSDYNKGMLTGELLRQIINFAIEKGLPVVVDPKGKDFGRYRDVTACTPNQKELGIAAGRNIRNDEELDGAARSVLESSGIKNMVVTRGAGGISLYSEHKQWRRQDYSAFKKDIVDVAGAGDTVVAVIAMCLAAGVSLEDACLMANAAALVAVSRAGVYQVAMAEAIAAMKPGCKCFSRNLLGPLLKRYKEGGKKIVFTNGCFDLLHAGHLRLLKQAKEMGDILVVGLNSDASIKRIKGPLRPVNNQYSRAELLSGISCVDFVTVFEEDTPLELIFLLRPDVLIKGADWPASDIVGREFVEAQGGEVKLIDLVSGESTTAIINRITGRRQAVSNDSGCCMC